VERNGRIADVRGRQRSPAAKLFVEELRSLQPGCPRSESMSDHIYKSLELTGSSSIGIEDAVNKAIAKASQTVRNIQWFNIVETRGHVQDGKVAHWQVTIKAGFTLE
jgi:flavin-binding protein dodecin